MQKKPELRTKVDSPELRKVEKLAKKVDPMETLNIQKLIETIETHYSTMVKRYAEDKSRGKKKQVNLKTLFLYAPEGKEDEFKRMYRSLEGYANHYARHNPKQNIKELAIALQAFLNSPNHQALQDLKKLAEKAEKSKTETPNLPPQPAEAKRSIKKSPSRAHRENVKPPAVANPIAKKEITPPVPTPTLSSPIDLANPTAVEKNDKMVPKPKHVTFILPGDPPPPPSNPSEKPSCTKEKKQLPLPSNVLDRLKDLINKIEEQEREFRKGAESRFAIGKGHKADAIQTALVNAKKHILTVDVNSLSNQQLFKTFLSYKEEEHPSIFEALNIQRLSFTRRNGNSLFFNHHATSLNHLLDSIENGAELDAEIMQVLANSV